MNSILIDRIRISGFRGLNDFEMSFQKTTVLTGVNNVGKTTILKALQLALGSRSFLSVDDLHISSGERSHSIVIDIRIVPINQYGIIQDNFSEDWEGIFSIDRIIPLDQGYCVPIRSEFIYNPLKSDFDKKQSILKEWNPVEGTTWQEIKTSKTNTNIEQIPFFYIEAQRDVVDDMKQRTSYLGKILSDVSSAYNEDEIKSLENMIESLNREAVGNSNILRTIQEALEGVDSAMDRGSSKIAITPFSKKIRDLNKNISIHYGEYENVFTMDYHGMGTRSWSSLLTFKAFTSQNESVAESRGEQFFPIIAIEEPEAHLHPNAQKKLYSQMNEMPGQKIISTHSPYIAACAGLNEIRGLYKNKTEIICGALDLNALNDDEKRKIRQKVINTRGEIFFSKALVLFEGETEEQALPILAEKYFGQDSFSMGIDFIGVGGAGQYGPFLQFAKSFNIPWYIFSDGEDKPVRDLNNTLRKITLRDSNSSVDDENIFIIKEKNDFEKMLLQEGYVEEVENVICKIEGEDGIRNFIQNFHGTSKGRKKTNERCRTCSQFIYVEKTRDYDSENGYLDALDDYMEKHKTEFAPLIALEIASSEKSIPCVIIELFEKVKKDMYNE